MVYLVDDWDVIEEYAGEKLGFYQILSDDGCFEVRVSTGRCGFKKTFEDGNDPLLTQILAFCKRHRYIRVAATINETLFFR